jgi:hypothetical protein
MGMKQLTGIGRFLIVFALLLAGTTPVYAQDSPTNLAAVMEVISAGVEVKRVDTANWIAVNTEAIVGVGDVIRTDATGVARITFFSDGVETEIQPDSVFQIDVFEDRGGDSFGLSAQLLLGRSLQRVARLLDATSSYDINTPSMELTVRGTEFMIRVEESGRAAMLVTDGIAGAAASGQDSEVPAGFGIRSSEDGAGLSDVVEATDFDQLDAAIDGCGVTVRTPDDVRLNVRIGPALDFGRAGTIDAAEILRFFGVSEGGGWYRLDYRGGFGWVLASDITLDANCAGLRVFPDDHVEDVNSYEALGEVIEVDDLALPSQPVPTPPPEDSPDEQD